MDSSIPVRWLLHGSKKGFYKDAGLDVTILPADPNNPNTFDQVLNGQADFAITHSGILQQRVQGAPVVALAAMLQFSPYCWMVKNNSDIFQPRDFTGKKLSKISSLENAELLVMLQRAGLDYQSLMAASQKGGIEQWLAGELDAVQVYVTNEPYTLTLRGVGHRLICPQKFGLNVYGDILYTSQAMLKNKPDIVERFYQASLKGWRYALHNMNESINVTQRDYAPHKSMQELAYEAMYSLTIFSHRAASWGACRWLNGDLSLTFTTSIKTSLIMHFQGLCMINSKARA